MMTKGLYRHLRNLIVVTLGGLALFVVPAARAQQAPQKVNSPYVNERNFDLLQPITEPEYAMSLWLNSSPQYLFDTSNGMLLAFHDSDSEILGATLAPLSDALRSQLSVPSGQGVLVASVRADGPSAQTGLKAHDVLLTLAGKSLATPNDLTKQLKAAGETPVTLKLLRAGKEMSLQVRSIYRVTLGPVGEQKKEYYLGIQLDGVDEAMRTQFALPKKQGLMVSEVVKNSPAEQAGIKRYDIVVELGGKPIETTEKLNAQVQASQGKPTTIKVLRAGQPLSITINAATRKVEFTSAETVDRASAYLLRALHPEYQAFLNYDRAVIQRGQAQEAKQNQDLRQLIQALRVAIDRLDRALEKAPIPKK